MSKKGIRYTPEQIITKLRESEVLYSLRTSIEKAQVLVEMWRKHYNMVRFHRSLCYRSPTPETIVAVPSHIQQFRLT